MKTSRIFTIATIAISLAALTAAATVSRKGAAIRVNTEQKGIVEITPLPEDIFRVTVLPKDGTPYATSQSAILPADESVAEIVTPDEVIIAGDTVSVHINRLSGNVTFYDLAGNLILSEAAGVDNSGAMKSVSFNGSGLGRLYGGGERGHSLTINGDSLVMYNRQNYGYTGTDPRVKQMGITVPYFVSDEGFGVLFDDYNNAGLQLGSDQITYRSETPLPLSYYFIPSKSKDLAGVATNYTLLTGRQPLPPFWAMGYVTSKYGYHNRQESLGAIDSLKTRGYPVDGMVLDLYWYGVETDMGRLEWDPKQWPDHKDMLKELKEKGVNTVLISQPYVNKIGAIDNYNMFSERGMLAKDSLGRTHDVHTWVGDAGLLDLSNPDTREWYWNRYKNLTEDGIAGWWGDLGDLEVHPLTIRHDNGQKASEYHNVYGNEWSRIIYEGLRKDFPQMRPLLLMRGGTAGLQRYGVFPWTTDVSRSWGGMEPQVKLMLSSGLSGLGYMGSDIGGFAVDPAHPTDPELYVRWLQMGVFNPMLRTHAQLKPEPYHYPAQEPILKEWIKMRYQWLPYNYTLAYENAAHGLPLARPLNFRGDNPEDIYATIEDEYLWGDEVLVAPVFKAGARSRNVIFPKGEWISWWNPAQKYAGGTGKKVSVSAPLDKMPLFVRRGAFIPQYMQPIENVTEYDPAKLTVKYFPSERESSYTLFDDDRLSPTSLEDDQYALVTFQGKQTGKQTRIDITSKGSYAGMPQSRRITLEIVGTAAPKSVQLNGMTLLKGNSGWEYDAKTRTATITFFFEETATLELNS